MTREENIVLLKEAKEGNKEALNTLVKENMGLCKSIAVRFMNRGTEYDDLVQIASLGMIKAINSFDFSFGTAFSTYAVPLIIGEIRRFLRDDGAIKVSRSIKKLGYDASKKREEFINENGREPKLSELCELCSVSKEELVQALDASSPIRSLSEPIGNSGKDESTVLSDLLSDSDDKIGKATDHIALNEALKVLPKEQRQLIYLRYVKEMSQADTGRILGLTQVKVSREEKKILNQLRTSLIL